MNIEVLKYTGGYVLIHILDPRIKQLDTQVYQDLHKVWLPKGFEICGEKESYDEEDKKKNKQQSTNVWNYTENTYLIVDSILTTKDVNGIFKILNTNLFNASTFDNYIIGAVDLQHFPGTDTIGIFSVCKLTKYPEGQGVNIINTAVSHIKNNALESIKKLWLGVRLVNRQRSLVVSTYIRAGFKPIGVTKRIPGGGMYPEFLLTMDMDRDSEYYVDEYEIERQLQLSNSMLRYADTVTKKMSLDEKRNIIDIDYEKDIDIEEQRSDIYTVVNALELFNKKYKNVLDYVDEKALMLYDIEELKNEQFQKFKDELKDLRSEYSINELYITTSEDKYDITDDKTLLILKGSSYESWDDILEKEYSEFIVCFCDYDLNHSNGKIHLGNFSLSKISEMKDVLTDIFNYFNYNQSFINYNKVNIILPLSDLYREILLRTYIYFGFDLLDFNGKYFNMETIDKSSYLTFSLSRDEINRRLSILNFYCKKQFERYNVQKTKLYDLEDDITFTRSTLERLKTLITSRQKTYGFTDNSDQDQIKYEYGGVFEIDNMKINTNKNDIIIIRLKNVSKLLTNRETLKYLPSVLIGEDETIDVPCETAFSFHTHPVSHNIENRLSIAPPSGLDLSTIITYCTKKGSLLSFVISREGIYCIYYNKHNYNRYREKMDQLLVNIEYTLKMTYKHSESNITAFVKKKMEEKYNEKRILSDNFDFPRSERRHAIIDDDKINDYYYYEAQRYLEWIRNKPYKYLRIDGVKDEYDITFIYDIVSIKFLTWKQLKNNEGFSYHFNYTGINLSSTVD